MPDPVLEEFWEPDRVRLTLPLETSGLAEFDLPGMEGETSPIGTVLETPRDLQGTDRGNGGTYNANKDSAMSKQVTQSGDPVTQSGDPVERLLEALGDEEESITELMNELGLEHRTNFRRNYLDPALKQGLIERTIPEKPNSSKQKYRRVIR